MSKISKKSSKQQPLLCCRACLSADCRLYDIYEYKVDDAFSRIIDTPVSYDLLPQYLCGWCLTLLRKCASFRDTCVRTQQLLTETLKWKMNTDGVQKAPLRSFHLTKTDVKIDCVPSENIIIHEPEDDKANPDMKYEIKVTNEMDNSIDLKNDINVINLEAQTGTIIKENMVLKSYNDNDDIFYSDGNSHLLKNEVEICELDGDFIEYVIEPDSNIELDHGEDEIKINDNEIGYLLILEDNKKKNRKRKICNDNDEVDSLHNYVNPEKGNKSNKKMVTMTEETDNNKVDFENGNESNDNIKNEYVLEDSVKQVKSVRQKRKYPKIKNDDFASFESANAVKVVILSKEEQLEEILSRKKSQNYLKAPFKCEECGKGFNMQEAYSNHRARQHDPGMEYPCGICGMRYKGSYLRKRHQEVHRLKFVCNECNFVCRNAYKAESHHAMHAGKTFECQYCGKSFKNRTSCFSHVRLAHPEQNVACAECGETFVSVKGLSDHKTKAHAEGLISRRFKCSTCSANFNSVKALNRHTDTAGEHADLRPCEQCGENCASEDALHEHVREKHPIESHHCEECDTTFSCAAAFDTHVRRKHLGQRYSNAYPRDVRRLLQRQQHRYDCTSRVCDQCGHKASNSSMLEYHMRSHLAVKPFPCPHCPKTLETRYKLNWHVRTHTGEKPFKCPECPLAFSFKQNFQRHLKFVHLKQHDSFPCAICARTYTTKYMMQFHVRTKHENMPLPKRTRKPKGTKPAVDNK